MRVFLTTRVLLSVPIVLVWIGANPFARPEFPARISEAARNGERTFVQSCASCHSVRASASLVGPSLKGYYSAHQPRPTDAAVRAVILQGRGRMPSFSSLRKGQIDDLIEYLKTL
jgi:mono/diheme cytochrome c family protein